LKALHNRLGKGLKFAGKDEGFRSWVDAMGDQRDGRERAKRLGWLERALFWG